MGACYSALMTQESSPAPRRAPTEEEAKALASTVRLRILRLCFKEQLTNKEIATRLDANPATVLYHVRKLVATGFLEAQEPRTGPSGAYEVPYLATEKSWQLEQDGRDLDVRRAVVGAFVDEMGQVPASAEVMISRLGVRLTKEGHDRFLDRVMGILEEIKAEEAAQTDKDSTRYSVFLAVHPENRPPAERE